MRFTASAFLGLALLVFGDVSWAQARSSPETEEDKARAWSNFMFEEVLLRSCEDPTLQSALALPQPKLTLEATDDGKTTVNARVGLRIHKRFVVDLKLSSPRNEAGDTTLASLDGLSKGSKGDLSLSWFGWRPQDYKDMYKEMDDLVKAAGIGGRMDSFLNPPMSRPSATAILGPLNYKEAVRRYQDEMKGDWLIPVFNLGLGAEQRELQFFLPSAGPPAGLRKTSESHTDYMFTASTGAYLWGRFYASANYRRGTKYKDGETQEFCTPTGAARILDCTTLVVAPPKKGKPEILEVEARKLFGSFGVAAHLKRDLEAKVTVVDLPVYLLQKLGTSEMELNLGARAQWRSDTKDVALSVFVGPALSTVLRMLNK